MEHEAIGRLLSITYRAHHALVDEKLKELDIGVSSGQFFLLIALYKNEKLCQHDLVRLYRIDKAAVARGIKKLEEEGFVTKGFADEDHRKSLIRLTDKAQARRDQFFGLLGDIEQRIKSYLTEKEIDAFMRITEKIHRCLSEEIAAERFHSDRTHLRQPSQSSRTADPKALQEDTHAKP